MTDSASIQEVEWKMLEAEKEGSVEKANRILGEFEAKHPGLLAARMYCEVGFEEKRRIMVRRSLPNCTIPIRTFHPSRWLS